MKKAITFFMALSITLFFCSCGNQQETVITEEISKASSSAEENPPVDTPEDDSTEHLEKLSTEKPSNNGTFNYFLPGGTSINSGLHFNEPSDFFYNKNGSSNAECIFEQTDGEKITISSCSTWDIERLNNYKNDGTWESPWEEKAETTNEYDTPYGIVTVISGYSELIQCEIDNCFLDYMDVQWYIERKQGENPKPIQEILNEMFSSKETTSAKDNETITATHIEFSDEEYEYFLTDIGLSTDGEFIIENVFGFNFPFEDSSVPVTSGSSVQGKEDIASIKSFKFYIPEKENLDYIISIEIPQNDILYLKNFLKTDSYEEGISIIADYAGNIFEAKLVSLQKEDIVDTKYGSLQIIDQTVSWTGFDGNEHISEYELVLFDINDHEILITYENPASANTYQGILKDMLPQIVGTN